MTDYSDRELEPMDPPTFLEEVQLFLQNLDEAFPVPKSTRRHSITLNETGHLVISVWTFDSTGRLNSWSCNLDGETDMFQSMDDVIADLRKYIEQNAK